MKWIKKGKIFSPKDVNCDFSWMKTHAAVPIALRIYGDIYRIYFSTRDINNRSRPSYVEIDIKNPTKIIKICKNPVLKVGELGTFDESGVMPSWIENNYNKIYMYYIGWNLGVTVPFRNSIGLAISEDSGRSFNKYSHGPILDRSVIDPYFVASSCVKKDLETWKMWYLSCERWELENRQLKHYYHIKYAESKDGIDWKIDGIVCIDFKSEDEYAISRPSVIKEDDIYKMWYSYRGDSYRIGYAESVDGINWVRKDEEVGIDVSESGWDSEMIEYPFVFEHDGEKYMLYNGNNYGDTGFGLAILSE